MPLPNPDIKPVQSESLDPCVPEGGVGTPCIRILLGMSKMQLPGTRLSLWARNLRI